MKIYDVIIIGAGAAGLFAARTLRTRGRRVAILDMGPTPARKVMVSGGGRCNITNAAANRDRYFGMNPDFVRGALSRLTPADILEWMRNHNLGIVEKAARQYFCADGAAAVVDALLRDARGADIITNAPVNDVVKNDDGFVVRTDDNEFKCQSVIIASGGTSFGTLGVSDTGHKIAKKFGHKIVPVRPALCAIATKTFPTDFAGISIPVQITIGRTQIRDDMLFTHFGIGGPAVYRTTVRDIADGVQINLLPDTDIASTLISAKRTAGRKSAATILSAYLPARIAKWIAGGDDKNIADYKDTEIADIAARIHDIKIMPNDMKLHTLASAEVVRGGVDTADISSKTMESRLCPGLFLAGEVIDIAGDLGGFNLHWAWASGFVAGQNA